jgi:hypothetical protein
VEILKVVTATMPVLIAMELEEEPETRTGMIVVMLTVSPTSSVWQGQNCSTFIEEVEEGSLWLIASFLASKATTLQCMEHWRPTIHIR